MGGLGTTDEPSKSAKIGITALTTVFAVGFNFGLGPVSHVITAELPSSRLRDITYATASTVAVVTSFAVTFSIPYLLYEPYAALEARVGFIFGSISFVAAIFAIFCVPECKNMTLEEIDYLFNENTPLLEFKKFKHGHIIPEEVIEENQRRDDKPELETKETV
ncbi:unnamed protein product [Parascedosporium putredinis]|nr:unnamed protein product [Parascedosporium putredinis]CAI8005084.1 unnamed protein product [Parascedosporium putredinis]